jgi:hypothetical protein
VSGEGSALTRRPTWHSAESAVDARAARGRPPQSPSRLGCSASAPGRPGALSRGTP